MKKFELTTKVTQVITHSDGSIETAVTHNAFVTGGIDFIFNSMFNSTTKMAYIAVGSGATAVARADTALVTEITRVAATYTHQAGSTTATLEATLEKGVGTGAIIETGVFNAATGGTMLDRALFKSVKNKEADDELKIVFEFQFTQ